MLSPLTFLGRLTSNFMWEGLYQIYRNHADSMIFLNFFQAMFQKLLPLKFVDWLTSNFIWGILGRVSTKVREIMLVDIFLNFFSPIFKRYLLKFLGRLTSNVMWCILGRVSTKVLEIILMQQFCQSSVNAHGSLVSLLLCISVSDNQLHV